MKKIVLPGIVSGIVLLIFSYAAIQLIIYLLPSLAEEYYSPVFRLRHDRAWLYYLHPFVFALMLAWFWNWVKEKIQGTWLYRGLWMGFIYAIIATLPAMWITFSSLDVSLQMVVSWFAYGFGQACIAGLILAKLNP